MVDRGRGQLSVVHLHVVVVVQGVSCRHDIKNTFIKQMHSNFHAALMSLVFLRCTVFVRVAVWLRLQPGACALPGGCPGARDLNGCGRGAAVVDRAGVVADDLRCHGPCGARVAEAFWWCVTWSEVYS